MKSICVLLQGVYDIDSRVRRKTGAMLAAGYSVDVLALREPGGRKQYSLKGANVYTVGLGKQRGSLARYFFEYTAFFVWASIKVTMLMIRNRYDLIDVNNLPDFLVFAPFVAKWMGAKIVLDMHEITPEFYMSKYRIAEDSWVVRLLKYIEKVSVRFADHVININKPIEDLLVSRGMARSKSTIIMNVADENRFANTLVGSAAPAGLPGRDVFVMMYHGTLTHMYGVDIAIKAFSIAHHRMPQAEFWILGSGTEFDALRELSESLGLGSKVRLPGSIPSNEIAAWVNRADIGVLPIRRDVFLEFVSPNKLSEYISMGKAVIVARLKAIQHYFSDEALTYFEPNDAEDLARQMIRLYHDPELRRRQVVRSKEEHVPIRWSVMKSRYLTMVERLIGAAQPASPSAPETEVSEEAKALTGQK